MVAYVVVQETVEDEGTFNRYREKVGATIEAFGGRFIVRGGDIDVVEGEWVHPRLVVIEFSSKEQAHAWYNSPAYQEILLFRLATSTGNFVIVNGVL